MDWIHTNLLPDLQTKVLAKGLAVVTVTKQGRPSAGEQAVVAKPPK